MAACDAMTIMRDGRWIATVEAAETTAEDLADRMVGQEVDGEVESGGLARDPRADSPRGAGSFGGSGEPRLVVTDLLVVEGASSAGPTANGGVSLSLRPGDILGVAGVAGNGQVELAEALAGCREAQGSFVLDGVDLIGRRTAEWLDSGVVYVPEDRQRDGILPGAGITENLVLGSQRRRSRRGLINWSEARARAVQAIDEFHIKAPGPATPCGQLSGGNLQRVILARAFAHDPKVLVLHNPTRGLDLGSTAFVFDRVRRAAANGCTVIVISEDLDEVLALADRVRVIYAGRLVGDMAKGETDPYELGRLMTGVGA